MSATGRYLLDTNILSQLVSDPQGFIADKIRTVGANAVFTSIIVASELRFRALKARSPRLQERVDTILDAIECRPLMRPPILPMRDCGKRWKPSVRQSARTTC